MIPSDLIGKTITLSPGKPNRLDAEISKVYKDEANFELQVLSSDGSENGIWFVPSPDELETVR